MKQLTFSNATAVFVILILSILMFAELMYAIPYGPDSIENVSTSTRNFTSQGPLSRTDDRSTITIVRLNMSSQTTKWKAYVGNISGTITLDDSLNNTIYDWTMTSVDGEVYATRKTTSVTWGSIVCANDSNAELEQSALKHSPLTASDTLNNTFSTTTHKAFSTGSTSFPTDVCNHSVWLYSNDTADTSTWSEVLLYDGSYVVYASIINTTQIGYDGNQYFDFQMLLAANGSSGAIPAPEPYYFYVELS